MKLGCCVSMLASDKAGIGYEHTGIFSELGYDYIELPLAQVMSLSDHDFKEMYRKIQGIPVEVCNNFFPAGIRLTGDAFNIDTVSDYAKRAVSRAVEMGVKVIVLGSAGAKNIPDGFSHTKAKEQLIGFLHSLQDIVSAAGITIVLEPLNSAESNFILSLNEAIAVMKEADRKNIKVLIDHYHMRMENEDVSVILKAGSDLRHVHIASKEGRRFPNENDGEDYKSFFAALRDIGYNDRVSIEAYSNNIRDDAKNSASLLRSFIK